MNIKRLSFVITVVVIILVIAVVGWKLSGKTAGNLFSSRPKNTQLAPAVPIPKEFDPLAVAKTAPKAVQAQILYTPTGFNPATLTIKKGTTVIFQNQSANKSMWIESGFASTMTSASDIFSFTLNDEGAWVYHNKLAATHSGTITVTK